MREYSALRITSESLHVSKTVVRSYNHRSRVFTGTSTNFFRFSHSTVGLIVNSFPLLYAIPSMVSERNVYIPLAA